MYQKRAQVTVKTKYLTSTIGMFTLCVAIHTLKYKTTTQQIRIQCRILVINKFFEERKQ